MEPGTPRQTSVHRSAPDTPAAAGSGIRQSPRHRPEFAYTPSAFVAVAGLWLVSAPFVLDHRGTGGGFDSRWNDIVVGAVLIIVAMIRVIAPIGTGRLSLINVALGWWLVVAPFALGHSGTGARAATWNDIIVGVIVVMVAGVSFFTAEPRRSTGGTAHRRDPDRAGGQARRGAR